MEKIRCLIVEDDPDQVAVLNVFAQKRNDLEIVGNCSSAMAAVKLLNGSNPCVDLVLLDILLEGNINGLEFMELRGSHLPLVILFTDPQRNKNYRDHAVDGFRLDVVHYLQKPISQEKFDEAIERAKRRLPKLETPPPPPKPEKRGLLVSFVKNRETRKRLLNFEEIVWVETDNGRKDHLLVHTETERFDLISSLKNVLDQAKGELVRIHKSMLINPKHIQNTDTNFQVLELAGNKRVFVGEHFAEDVRNLFR